jgi:hypothetical protein
MTVCPDPNLRLCAPVPDRLWSATLDHPPSPGVVASVLRDLPRDRWGLALSRMAHWACVASLSF